ncbi:outer membrane protein insertion porin family [Amorphus orientalis]|uniref:Outer membrane protein assembly factor BamA n=1 Tax=Amorphus orientalis TaxID=649198 RepID=A0AAE3VPR9_9HYPH|nr:outer membrane protein insertion porin family [Amorphus orientalis]
MHAGSVLIRKLALAITLFAVASVAIPTFAFLSASPAEAAVVRSISVQGNTRVDPETVRAYLTIKPGESFGPSDIDESIASLFATGLFADVQIVQRGSSLVVTVQENPIINRVNFEGNRGLSDETLAGVVQSKERSVLTTARVQSDVERILETYRRRGNYQASVEPKTIDLQQNRVDLVFEIDEGGKTQVARITFIGNEHFSDGRLRDVIKTRQSGYLGWLRTTDTYDPDRFAADQELIRRFYYDHGYADFRIISSVADFDRERNTFFITYTVEEGPQYRFGEIEVDTTLSNLDPEQLRRRVETRSGRVYSSELVEKSLENLTIEAAKQGYAFAQVRPRGRRDFDEHTISIDYQVDEGPRAYVERINIIGNTSTRDYVIRREFDLVEGDAYNRILVDRAERRLNDLGFFETVRITTEPGSAPDRVIVNVFVEEKPTGKVSFGVGYSTSDGVIGDVSIEERNFLGRGQYVKFLVGGGSDTTNIEFSFTEPFFLGRRISAGFDVYNRTNDADSTQSYDQTLTGGALRFGFPLNDDTTLQPFYRLYDRDISIPDFTTEANCIQNQNYISDAVCQTQGSTVTSLVGASLIYNTLDNTNFPRDGIFAKFTQEVAGLGGDTHFSRTSGEARFYKEVIPAWGVVGVIRGEGGMIKSIGDDGLDLQDQYFVGGSVIRGFETSGIGPRDASTGDSLGGQYYIAGTAEATFPLPLIPQEIGFSGAVFTDAGSLWAADPEAVPSGVTVESDDFELRWTAGFGILWKSPLGPLRADFAWPIVMNDADETQIFRIGGGTRF